MVKLSTQPHTETPPLSTKLSTQPGVRLSTQPVPPLSTQSRPKAIAQTTDVQVVSAKLSTQAEVVFDNKKWKRSAKKTGYLIKRLAGYSISEDEYGVSYLFVLSRKPDRTSADSLTYPLAGFFNWVALASAGRLTREKKRERRTG